MVDAARVNPWMLAVDAALHPYGGDRDNAHETHRVLPKIGHLQGIAPNSAHWVRTKVPLMLPILPRAMSMTVWNAE